MTLASVSKHVCFTIFDSQPVEVDHPRPPCCGNPNNPRPVPASDACRSEARSTPTRVLGDPAKLKLKESRLSEMEFEV